MELVDPPRPAPRPLATHLWPAVALLLAALLIATALAAASTASDGAPSLWIGGCALAGGTVAAVIRLLRTDASAAAMLGAAALLLLDAAVGVHAGLALPIDAMALTVSRPPSLLVPLCIVLAALGAMQVAAVLRGGSAARLALFTLVPLLALEGLPLAAPPELQFGAAALCAALTLAERGRQRIPLALPVAALVAVLALAAALGEDPGTSVPVAIRVAALALAFVAIAGQGDPLGAARSALAALLATLVAVGLLALHVKALLAGHLGDVDFTATELSLFGRHPNLLAPWIGAGAVIALLLIGRRGLRALAVAALPLAVLALLLTSSRLALVAAVGAALLPALAKRRTFLLRLAAAAAVIALGVLALPSLRTKLLSKASLAESWTHRAFRMSAGLDTALAAPLLGQGPNCWFRQGEFTPRTRYEGESTSDHPHDLPIALFEGAGIAGLVALAALLLATARLVKRIADRRDAHPDEWLLARAVALGLLAQLATNLLDMGDALDTLVPSRLLVDCGILAALARACAAGPPRESSPWPLRACVAAAALLAVPLAAGSAFARAGRAMLDQDQLDRARVHLDRAAALMPFATDVHVLRMNGLFGAGKSVQAREALDAALRLAPRRPDLHVARSRLASRLDDPSLALEAARRALALDPFGSTARELAPRLAALLAQTGDRAGAIAALSTALRSDPSQLRPLLVEAKPGRVALGPFELTVDDLLPDLGADVGADAPLAERRRIPIREAELFLIAGQPDRALRSLDALHALEGAPSVTWHQYRQRALLAAGDAAGALAESDAALALYDSPNLHADRADALLALGRVDDAIASDRRGLAAVGDIHFWQEAYRDLLDRTQRVLAVKGDSAARAAALDALVFFVGDDVDRAGLLLDLAREREQLGDATAAESARMRALALALAAPATDGNRLLARRLGEDFAAARAPAKTPSLAADDLERFALRRNCGPVAHEFRVKLLSGLGLAQRAAAAKRDLAEFK